VGPRKSTGSEAALAGLVHADLPRARMRELDLQLSSPISVLLYETEAAYRETQSNRSGERIRRHKFSRIGATGPDRQ